MTYYHGTAKCYLPSILKEGLIPNKNIWKATWSNNTKSIAKDEKKGIYVTKDNWRAFNFAKTRVAYLAAKPGGPFVFGDCKDMDPFHKDVDAPVIHTLPIVLAVELPEGAKLTEDPHAYDWLQNTVGWIYKGSIPPSCITVVKGEKNG